MPAEDETGYVEEFCSQKCVDENEQPSIEEYEDESQVDDR